MHGLANFKTNLFIIQLCLAFFEKGVLNFRLLLGILLMLKIYDDRGLDNWVTMHFGLLILFCNKNGLILTLRRLMSYIYVYDISSLRVNDLTLILLTWRKR